MKSKSWAKKHDVQRTSIAIGAMRGAGYALAFVLLAQTIQAQTKPDTVVVILPDIIVEAVRPKTLRKVGDVYTQQDPSAELIFINPSVNTAIPGVSKKPYVDLPFGGQLYIGGVPFLGQAYPNFGLVSAFSGHNSEIRRRESTALKPAMDASFEMYTRVQHGSQVNLDPLQASMASGRVGKSYKIGVSAEFHGAMPFLPKSYRNRLSIMGVGPRASIIAEVGGEKGKIAAEAYWSHRYTNLQETLKNTETQGYNGTLRQGFFTLRGNLLLGAMNAELLTNYQFSSEQSRVLNKTPAADDIRNQRIDYMTVRGTLAKGTAKIGVDLYNLKRTAGKGNFSDLLGGQIFAEQVFMLPLEFIVRANGRIDINRDTHASLYLLVLRQFGPFLVKISAGQLYDPVIAQKTADNIAGFTSESNRGQQVLYGRASLEYRRDNHTLSVSLESKKVDLPQYYTEATISGTSYRLSYEWTDDNFFLSLGATYRDLIMRTQEKTLAVPLSSRFEGKFSGGINVGNISIGMAASIREHTMFPTVRDSLVNIGRQIIITPFIGIEKHPFTFSVSAPNALGLLGVRNYAGAYDGERIALPGVALFNVKYSF